MKNNWIKKSLIAVVMIAVAFSACKKDENEPLQDSRLTKIASWNPATGEERVHTAFTYDAAGKVQSVKQSSGSILTATYNGDKLVSLTGKNTGNGELSYTAEYNSDGRVIKITHVNKTTTDYGNVRTFTYNAAGKVSQISFLNAGSALGTTPNVTNYTWNGDNLASSGDAGANASVSSYVSYDSKINPYSVDGGIAMLMYGTPASKNNWTELKTTYNGVIGGQKRSYESNAAGYTTSMKLLDGSNEGSKFYYSN